MNAMRLLRLPALAVLALTATGCLSPLPYSPDGSLVRSYGGPEEYEAELKSHLRTATAPPITDVTLEDDAVVLDVGGVGHPYGWYGPAAFPGRQVISGRTITKLEVYENNKLWIYRTGQPTFELIFTSVEDAKKAADLFESLRVWAGGSRSERGEGADVERAGVDAELDAEEGQGY
jgi:hypothetical protein